MNLIVSQCKTKINRFHCCVRDTYYGEERNTAVIVGGGTFFCWISSLIEDSSDNFYVTKGQKSIAFCKNNWF